MLEVSLVVLILVTMQKDATQKPLFLLLKQIYTNGILSTIPRLGSSANCLVKPVFLPLLETILNGLHCLLSKKNALLSYSGMYNMLLLQFL